MRAWLIPAQLCLLFSFGAMITDCSGKSEAGDCGPRPIYPCAQCGSDWLHEAECRDGNWTCPKNTVFTNTCPDGTCFGAPVSCCGPNGQSSAGICSVSETNPAPSGGPCPKGWVSCHSLQDSGVGSGGAPSTTNDAGDATLDVDAQIADCLEMDYSCPFCCGKFHYEAMQAVFAALQPCVCAGACKTECSDNGFCADPKYGPSSDCEPCLLAQLEPAAACASALCTSADCAPYLSCLATCGP
jgi:hypothetical protein